MEISKIIEQYNLGDKSVLHQIYERMSKTIFWLGYMITGNYNDAEIVLESTMLEVAKRAYKFHEKKNGEVWILSIAREKAMDKKLNVDKYNTKEYIDIINDNEELLEEDLINKLRKMDTNEKQILLLKGYAGISEKSIAKILGLRVSQVKKLASELTQNDSIIEKIKLVEVYLDANVIKTCDEPKTNEYKKEKSKNYVRKSALRVVGVFAVIVIIILLADYIKYTQALKFFAENNIDKDNLAKDEIVEIYKDINKEAFSNELTKETIENELSKKSIEGEVIAKSATASVQDKWELLNSNKYIEKEYKNVDIEQIQNISFSEEFVTNNGINDKINTIVEYNGEDGIYWSVVLEGFYLGAYGRIVKWGDYYVVCGESDYVTNSNPIETYVVLINSSGEVLWNVKVDMEAESTGFADIILKKEKIIIVTNCNENQFGFAELDIDGKLTVCGMADKIGASNIINTAIKKENYYCLTKYNMGYSTEMIRINDKCQMVESMKLNYKDNVESVITNMIEYNGELYLTGYEIGDIYEFRDNRRGNLPHNEEEDEKSTKEFRELYKAVIWKLEIDKNGNLENLEEVYSVDGAAYPELVINKDGNLVWDVKYIEEYAYYNSTVYDSKHRTYRFIIDDNMEIMNKIKTDRVEEFLD